VRRHSGGDGVIQQEYAYSNGELQGVQKSYDDGLVSRVYLMVPGNKRPVVQFQLNKKGQPTSLECGDRSISKQDAEWCGMNGKQSTVSLYDEKGSVRSTEQYLWGKLHGLSRKFNVSTGAVREEEKYDHGKLQKDGEKLFNKAGELLVKTDCDDARASCTETEFFEGDEHEVKTVSVWKKGLLAERTSKYQNGKVRDSMTTEKDHMHIVRYDDEGRKSLTASTSSLPAGRRCRTCLTVPWSRSGTAHCADASSTKRASSTARARSSGSSMARRFASKRPTRSRSCSSRRCS